jgi:quercetin dioxygenase-like cupin family protein
MVSRDGGSASPSGQPWSATPVRWGLGRRGRGRTCWIGGKDDAVNAVPADRVQLERGERVIVNPASGERIVIRTSGAETEGRVLIFDLWLPPAGHVPARHAHPIQEERFTVLSGRMRFVLGRQTILAAPGDTVLVPPGTPHWFGNIGMETACARVEVRPALRMEELLEASVTLAMRGGFFGARLQRLSELARFLLELALFLREFERELAVPNVPTAVARVFLAPFAWMSRCRASRDPT